MRLIFLTITAIILSACATSTDQLTRSQFPLYIQSAFNYLEKDERKDRQELREFLGVDPVLTEWCAAFVNQVFALHDIPGSESVSDVPLMARSFLSWGQKVNAENIKPGDVVVFPRGNKGWQGHVGFYIGSIIQDDIEWYLILGGNQSNEVNMAYYKASKALGIRRQKSS